MTRFANIIVGVAAVLLAILGRAADFIRFYVKPAPAVGPVVEWAVQGVTPCRPFGRGILKSQTKAVGDVVQLMKSDTQASSKCIPGENGSLTASPRASMADDKRIEMVPVRNNVVITLSILKWMLSLSGPQLLRVIREIMDVICYGGEPDMTQISPKNRPSFNAIMDQISSLSQQNYVGNHSKTNPKPTYFKSGNIPLRGSGGDTGPMSSTSPSGTTSFNKELKEKVKEIFFFKFYPKESVTHFEEWLRNKPDKCVSEKTILQSAENWLCNVPKEKWLWSNNQLCRQLVLELRKTHTDEYYRAWIGIVDVKKEDNLLVIMCKNEEYRNSIREAIGGRMVWGMNVEYEVVA